MTGDGAKKSEDAFVLIRRTPISWALSAERIVRVVPSDEAKDLEPIFYDEALGSLSSLNSKDGHFTQALLLNHQGRERAIFFSGRLDIVRQEGLIIAPLPALCRAPHAGELIVRKVAIADDEVKFLIVELAN